MNISASQCSSGCESGWTLYLDQSSVSGNDCRRDGRVVDEDCGRKNAEEVGQQDEEEDLSMVSDASSGPPHFHKDEDGFDANGCFFSTSVVAKKSQKKKVKDPSTRQQHSPLDDTASSPVLSSSKASTERKIEKKTHTYKQALSLLSLPNHNFLNGFFDQFTEEVISDQ